MKKKLTILLIITLIICLAAAGCNGMTALSSGGGSASSPSADTEAGTSVPDETDATGDSDVPPPEEGSDSTESAADDYDVPPPEDGEEDGGPPVYNELPSSEGEADGVEGSGGENIPSPESEATGEYGILTFADGQELDDGTIMSLVATIEVGEGRFFIQDIKLALETTEDNGDGSQSTSTKEYYAYDVDALNGLDAALGSEGAKIKGTYKDGILTGTVTIDGKSHPFTMNEVDLPFDDSAFNDEAGSSPAPSLDDLLDDVPAPEVYQSIESSTFEE